MCKCGDGRPREPVLSEAEGSKPSEAQQLPTARMDSMKLTINGEPQVSSAETLGALVAGLGMKPDRVAIELNREIVPRDQWPQTPLHDGDRLEIVHFVGGGSSRPLPVERRASPPGHDAAGARGDGRDESVSQPRWPQKSGPRRSSSREAATQESSARQCRVAKWYKVESRRDGTVVPTQPRDARCRWSAGRPRPATMLSAPRGTAPQHIYGLSSRP